MTKNTHCEATLKCGANWRSAELTGYFSGPPDGVISMLFTQLARNSPDEARKLLETLKGDFEYEQANIMK